MKPRIPITVGEEKSEKRDMWEDDEKTKRKSEDWCFFCKDGGKLNLCDHRQCVKAYHSRCLKKRKLSVPISKLPWHCSWHTCSKCQDHSTFFCYCCPTALCNDCLDAVQFLPIKEQYGFCNKCRKLALSLDNKEVDVDDLSRSERFFKEYYEIVKNDEGFSLKDLQSQEAQSEIKQKCKSSSISDSGCYSIESVDRHKKMTKLKKFKGQGDREFNSSGKSQNEAVACNAPEVFFASIVPGNIKLVYLKRSLVQDLLNEPQSFEGKVKGSYVRVESAPSDGPGSNSYQLMQVIGVKKASSGQDTDIKLQLLDWPNDICINSLSDANFSEAECEVLRQKMNVGLLKKPTVDELEEMARNLHKDITDHTLAREKRALQSKIDFANEKGRRFTLFQLLEKKKLLDTPSYRLWLLNTPPKVIPELPEPSNSLKGIKFACEDAFKREKTNARRLILVDDEHARNRTASDLPEIKSISGDTDDILFSPVDNECSANKTTSDTSEIESISKHNDEQKKTNGSPRFIPVHDEHVGNETALEQPSSNPDEEYPQNLISLASVVDVDLDELLDQLVKPKVHCSYIVGVRLELVQFLEDGLLLLLKKVPISDFKSMIEMANGVFKHFNEFPINYTSLYERVRNYIRCSSLLASTEEFRQCSSMEVLAAKYDSGKKYNAMVHKRMKNLSTYMSEVFTTVQDRVFVVEKSLVKLETEHSVCGSAQQSGTLRGVLEKLKCAKDALMNDLESPVKSKNQCCFEEVWEAFMNAKADLRF